MRLAQKIPARDLDAAVANDVDPRETTELDVIDLASRNAFPAVAGRKSKTDGMGLVAGIALVAGLGMVTLWTMSSARTSKEDAGVATAGASPQPVTGNVAPAGNVVPPVPLDPNAPPAQLVADPGPTPVFAAPPAPGNVAVAGPATNPFGSPTVIFDAGSAPGMGSSAAAAEPALAPAGAQGEGNSASDFAGRLGGVGGGTARASAMANPTTTVTQGTLIPAVLETAIDTNVPGFVRAVVSQDVRSFDGTRVLVPRSSRLIGQYQSGMQNGQRRAYVIWTRLIRPDGVSVNLASPGVGFDGSTGLAGSVSGAGFFKRFGSAMLLSVVGGLGGLVSGGVAPVVLGGAGQSAAATAAQQDGQKGPTVRVRIGEPIRIFTSRDLDFSQVG